MCRFSFLFELYEKIVLSAKITYKYCEQKKAQDSKEAQSISEEEWKQATVMLLNCSINELM